MWLRREGTAEAGRAVQVIMPVGEWKREAMPIGYIRKYDEGELQALPTADLKSLQALRKNRPLFRRPLSV